MTVTIRGIPRRVVVGNDGVLLLMNGTEIDGVIFPGGRVAWSPAFRDDGAVVITGEDIDGVMFPGRVAIPAGGGR